MPAPHVRTATRLVFSEADGISGLVVDRYGDYLVVQPTALGIAQRLESIVGILQELLQPRGIVLKLDKAMAKLEGMDVRGPRTLTLSPGRDGATDRAAAYRRTRQAAHSVRRRPHLGRSARRSQSPFANTAWPTKSIFAPARKRASISTSAKTAWPPPNTCRGRRVLDMFCYTGGFAMTAAALGGATEVLGIDGSKTAIAQAAETPKSTVSQSVRFECGDGFQNARRAASRRRKVRCGDFGPAKIRPRPRGRKRRADGLPSAQSGRG